MFRQGDVLIIPVDEFPGVVPEKDKLVDRDRGRVVLAYGEVTGHAHAIESTACDMFTFVGQDDNGAVGNDNDRLLVCMEPVKLSHEEHDTVKLPVGSYYVRRQREYHPSEIRTVAD